MVMYKLVSGTMSGAEQENVLSAKKKKVIIKSRLSNREVHILFFLKT